MLFRLRAQSFAGVFGGQLPSSYSTAFADDENPLSEGGIWINGLLHGLDWQNVQSLGGVAQGTAFNSPEPYDDSIAHLDPAQHAIPNDHELTGVVHKVPGYNPPSSHEIELLLRWSITENVARGYEIQFPLTFDRISIVRWNGPVNDFTLLNHTPIPDLDDDDVCTAKIVGSTITVYVNGDEKVSLVDATWPTGNPGVGFWIRPGGTIANYGWKSWSAQGAT